MQASLITAALPPDAPYSAESQGFGGRPLSTLNQNGSRRWITPRPSRGRFLTARRIVAYTLILIFALLPYLTINSKPVILLDIAARRFTLFGRTFLPTDAVLLSLFMIAVFVTVFFLTSLFGRVWCGWACPQTVYMEFLFRPIERLFQGTPGRRKNRLQSSGVGAALKFVVYLILSLFLAHTFLAYFVGVERLAQWVRQSPFEHPVPFFVMLATTALMLFDFGYFREQLCIVACPYGRFQSVMLDRNSLIVSYDHRRGEPRGKAPRQPDAISLRVLGSQPAPAAQRGDCVDCRLCVATCPTGIDIRDGLQLECINCAQCIDACDAVMKRLGRPTGLIRYSSQAAMEGARPRILRPRVALYAVALSAIVSAIVYILATAAPADITVLRGLGRPFTEFSPTEIANPIRLKLLNRTDAPATYTLDAATDGVRIVCEEPQIRLDPGQSRTVPAMVVAPRAAFSRGAFEVQLRVSDGAGFTKTLPYRLLGPGDAAHPHTSVPTSEGATP